MRQPSCSWLRDTHFLGRSGDLHARLPHVPGRTQSPVLVAKWALESCMRPSIKWIFHESPTSAFCKLLKYKEVFENPLFQRMDIRLHLIICGGVSACLGQI